MCESFQVQKRLPRQLLGQSEFESELRLVRQETAGFHTNLDCLSLSLSSMFFSKRCVRAWLGTHRHKAPKKKVECQWTERVKSPLGLGVARLASFVT